MKIIKMLPRRGRIYEVQLSDGTYINLDRAFADSMGICCNMELSDEKANSLEDESDLIRCKNRALYYISQSNISEKKLTEKLIKAGFLPQIVKKATARIKELGLINDDDYAVRLLERCNEKNLSGRNTLEKMVMSGISRDKAKEMCIYDSVAEQKKIEALLKSKYKNKLSTQQDVKKTADSLCRNGFKFSDVRAVMKNFDSSMNFEE